ncbi:MAG: methylmalonyl-CoA mutase family protein [Mucinivorans sp.]
MAEKTKLMAEFPPVSSEKWMEVITADLKGADYDKRLVWRTLEGFSVQPFYRAQDLTHLKHMGGKAGEFPYVNGAKSCGNWLVRQTIVVEDVAEANKQALEVLCKGVDSLGLVINNKEFSSTELDALLSGIELKAVELAFSGCGVAGVASLFIDKITREGYEADQVRATFGIDPLKRASMKGSFCADGKCFDKIASLIKKGEKFTRLRFISASGVLFNSCGSNAVQELAFALSAAHEYCAQMLSRGLTIDQVAPSIKFNMAIGPNYFLEIAKFRAARLLWANITKAYKPTRSCSSKMRVHATTSEWNMTVYDAYVNVLRGTTEAMSAALAGVDSIEVMPFNHPWQAATDFSSRIARNAQLLLKEEAHMNQVVDPAAGSYYVENLTDMVSSAAWDLFKEVEEKGGYIEALKQGFIQKTVLATSAQKDKNISTRRDTLLGTNQYPNFGEVVSEDVPKEAALRCQGKAKCCCAESTEEFETLKPYRGAMAFEALRMDVDRSGRNPRAFMLTCGALAFARARAQFACNFFGCAGIRCLDNTYFETVAQGVDEALASKSEIVVICSSDDDYATLAIEAYNALKGHAIVVVAGEPACRAELEAAGISHFISVKANVLDTLKSYIKELGI